MRPFLTSIKNFGWFWSTKTGETVWTDGATHTEFALTKPEVLGIPQLKSNKPAFDDEVLAETFKAGWVRCHISDWHKTTMFVNAGTLQDAQKCIRAFQRDMTEFVIDIGSGYSENNVRLDTPAKVREYLQRGKAVASAQAAPVFGRRKAMAESDRPVLKLGSQMRTVDINTPVIKLGSNPAKAKLAAFMNDYHDATQDHPMDRKARLTTNASVEVSAFDGAIHLSDVRALTPRQGGGKEAMMLLCRLADLHGVKMTLTAKAYGDYGRMTTEQLKSWYEDFGFTEDEDSFGDEFEGYDMIRYPN